MKLTERWGLLSIALPKGGNREEGRPYVRFHRKRFLPQSDEPWGVGNAGGVQGPLMENSSGIKTRG